MCGDSGTGDLGADWKAPLIENGSFELGAWSVGERPVVRRALRKKGRHLTGKRAAMVRDILGPSRIFFPCRRWVATSLRPTTSSWGTLWIAVSTASKRSFCCWHLRWEPGSGCPQLGHQT